MCNQEKLVLQISNYGTPRGALHPPRKVVSVATDNDCIHRHAQTASAPAGAVSG